MKISAKTQQTQAKVLQTLQHGHLDRSSAKRIGAHAGVSPQQAAAALTLLEGKGLVERRELRKKIWVRAEGRLNIRSSATAKTVWSLTQAGLAATVEA